MALVSMFRMCLAKMACLLTLRLVVSTKERCRARRSSGSPTVKFLSKASLKGTSQWIIGPPGWLADSEGTICPISICKSLLSWANWHLIEKISFSAGVSNWITP